MVAEAAKVDPALVARAFDGKHGLFVAAIQWPWDPVEVVPLVAAGPKSRAGHRMARLAVDTWEDPDGRATILALLTSTADSDVARTLLREFVTTQILVPFVRTCGFDQPELRGALLAAHHIGLVTVRYVMRIEPLASLDADRARRHLGAGHPTAADRAALRGRPGHRRPSEEAMSHRTSNVRDPDEHGIPAASQPSGPRTEG